MLNRFPGQPSFVHDECGVVQGRVRKGMSEPCGRHTERELNCFPTSFRPLRMMSAASYKDVFGKVHRDSDGRHTERALNRFAASLRPLCVMSAASRRSMFLARLTRVRRRRREARYHTLQSCPASGAVRRAKRANEKRENSGRSFPDIFVQTAFGGRGLRPHRSLSRSDVEPPPMWEGAGGRSLKRA